LVAVNGAAGPLDWEQALARAAGAARLLVLGETDVGKSSFILELLRRTGGRTAVIDLDPGQKMFGPPGTVGLAFAEGCAPPRLDRYIWVGTTSASAIGAIARGAARLVAAAEAEAVILNTAGFVRGLGLRLQLATIAAVRPTLIVAIGEDEGLDPILAGAGAVPALRIPASPHARRKTPAARAAIRQAAFAEALIGAQPRTFAALRLEPGQAMAFEASARPVCALADAGGEDMCIGLLLETQQGQVRVHCPPPPRPPAILRLGKIWAEPAAEGWKLLERLSPAWAAIIPRRAAASSSPS
jgi:polynucleotide 5'-hydroxyl-kinase GRC3/NOL9